MAKINIPDKAYTQLLEDLQAIRIRTEQQAMTAVNVTVLRGYWDMGKRLSHDTLIGEKSTRTILTRLAVDLGLEYTFLTRVIKYFNIWPNQCPVDGCPYLTWSHYKKLLSIQNEDAREFYFNEANDQKWNTRQLTYKIKTVKCK